MLVVRDRKNLHGERMLVVRDRTFTRISGYFSYLWYFMLFLERLELCRLLLYVSL